MLYNEIFRCHGNICCVTFIDVYFCNVHIIGPINVYANFEISRCNIDELFHKTSRDAKKRYSYAIAAATLLIDMSIRNILQSTRSLYDFLYISVDPKCVFCYVFGDLDLDF